MKKLKLSNHNLNHRSFIKMASEHVHKDTEDVEYSEPVYFAGSFQEDDVGGQEEEEFVEVPSDASVEEMAAMR